jgi:polyphenol oxidase
MDRQSSEFQRLSVPDGTVNVQETGRLRFGFSETGTPSTALQRFLEPSRPLFLRQVHGARIITVGEWVPGIEADGLILTKPGCAAVVQTADCVPLFFGDRRGRVAGVVHAGWRGLQQGIEKVLLARLAALRLSVSDLDFFLGPAIAAACYEVGPELYEAFTPKPYRDSIFVPRGSGKFLLDIKLGLRLSLLNDGVADRQITDCGLCTHCLPDRFPSFRRDGGTGRRIFNFAEITA